MAVPSLFALFSYLLIGVFEVHRSRKTCKSPARACSWYRHPSHPFPLSLMNPVRYVLVSGFLGAGKTTALAALAGQFAQNDRRVAVITNDQGVELVDTATLRAQGLDTREVSGGSFCTRFEQLADVLKTLEKTTAPEVILAEAVGNSADLAATVARPLQQLRGDDCVIAPVSTLVDPLLAEQVLGLEPGDPFSDKVLYVYRRQIEEADLVIITQADLLDEARLERMRAALAAGFPRVRVLAVSARTGQGVKDWATLLENGAPGAGPATEIDDALSAEGQALVGWLNSTIEFYGAGAADPQALLMTLMQRLQVGLPDVAVAHFKIALRPDGSDDVAVISLARRGGEPEFVRQVDEPVDTGELTINLRAETAPETLHTGLRQAVVELAKEFPGLKTEFAHLHYFRPAKPMPRI
jgi:Ni2+-binding GTPase involved in maturation of urease and hydrogenase